MSLILLLIALVALQLSLVVKLADWLTATTGPVRPDARHTAVHTDGLTGFAGSR